MNLWILALTFLSLNAFGNTVRIGFSGSILSKQLTGTNTTGDDGKLVSNTNFHYGLNFRYALSQSFHFLLNYQNRSYDFDNTLEIIAGEEAFVLSRTETGIRWIVHPRVAFRMLVNLDQELAFDVDINNQAVLYSENINYLSVFYDQVVFLGGSMFSGFKVGYDLPGSGDTIQNRTAVRYGIFAVLNAFEVFYEVRNKTKETDDLTFTDTESALTFTYVFRF